MPRPPVASVSESWRARGADELEALLRLAVSAAVSGDDPRAEPHARVRLAELLRWQGRLEETGPLYHHLGNLLLGHGLWSRAAAVFQQAADVAAGRGDTFAVRK